MQDKSFISGSDMIDLYGQTFTGTVYRAMRSQAYEKMMDVYTGEFRQVEADL